MGAGGEDLACLVQGYFGITKDQITATAGWLAHFKSSE